MVNPFMHSVWCEVVVFYRVIPHTKYQVVSVLPSVAPSGIRVISRCAMSHGYDRLVAYEAGANRSHSKNTWLSWRSGKMVLSSEHIHRKMNKSHMEMWLASWPTGLIFRHQWCHINGGRLRHGSWITKNQLWGILVLVGAHFKLKLFNK